jgi:hypothetical protein
MQKVIIKYYKYVYKKNYSVIYRYKFFILIINKRRMKNINQIISFLLKEWYIN